MPHCEDPMGPQEGRCCREPQARAHCLEVDVPRPLAQMGGVSRLVSTNQPESKVLEPSCCKITKVPELEVFSPQRPRGLKG